MMHKLAAAIAVVCVFFSAAEAVSRSYEEACSSWQYRPLASSQVYPQWEGGTIYGACTAASGSMNSTARDNVVEQLNFYRELAGLSSVVLNTTLSAQAQDMAWWASVLIERDQCEGVALENCLSNTNSTCYTNDRRASFQRIRRFYVGYGAASQVFDVAARFPTSAYGPMLFHPGLQTVGVGMYGNTTFVYFENDVEFIGYSAQVLDLSDVSASAASATWFAFPPDGIVEVAGVSDLSSWLFGTTASFNGTPSVTLYDLTDNFAQLEIGTSTVTVASGGWAFVEFGVPSSYVVAGVELFEVQITTLSQTWVYRPYLVNCSAPAVCGDGLCQGPYEDASCSDCQSCGAYPSSLEGKPAKCVNGTWLVSGSVELAEGETLDAGDAALRLIGDLKMRSSSALRFSASGDKSYGSIEATGCSYLDGTLVYDVNFRVGAPFVLTVVNSSGGLCELTKRQADGTSFRRVEVNFNGNSDCRPESETQSSSSSYGLLITPRSGCGDDDDALIIGLTAGLVGGALLLVTVVIVAGLVLLWLRKRRRNRTMAQLQENVRNNMGV